MSLKDNLSKFAGKAKDVVDKSGDKIASGVDKATDMVDKKTHGKHHDKLEKLDNLAAKLDKKSGAAADGAADDTVVEAVDPATEVATAAPDASFTAPDPTTTATAPDFPTPQP